MQAAEPADVRPGDRPEAAIATLVRGLRGSGPARRSLADQPLRECVLADLGQGPLDWAVEVADAGATLVGELNADDPLLPTDDVARAAETALLELLLMLGGSPSRWQGTATAHHRIIRDSVARGVSTERVTDAVRQLQEHWSDRLLDEAVARGAGPGMLRAVVVALGRGVDRFLDAQMKEYLVERERYLGSVEAQRKRMVEALVDGRPVDPGLLRERLAVELDDHHVAVVLATLDDDVTGHRDLHRTAIAIGRTLDTRSLVQHETGDGTLWLWAAGRQPPRIERLAGSTPGGVRFRVGVGSAHPGAEGFRRTHREALDALRFARDGRHGPVVLHRDVALAALLSLDLERARWFVGTWLGPLAARDPAAAQLRDTLHHHHRCAMRLVTTAAQLHLHRNTLVHRLHRIEALLGHPITENAAEVRCALLLADEFGERVLT